MVKSALPRATGRRVARSWHAVGESKVREFVDVQRDSSIKDALFGRIFGILKHAEMAPEDQKFKARIVVQGNNARSKFGVSLVDLYEEIANSPQSFAAAQCALAAAAFTDKEATLPDAERAFLQSRIDGPGRVQTWVEVPRKWWPTAWFHDQARTQPRFARPVCPLERALHGQPEPGALWEKKPRWCAREARLEGVGERPRRLCAREQSVGAHRVRR